MLAFSFIVYAYLSTHSMIIFSLVSLLHSLFHILFPYINPKIQMIVLKHKSSCIASLLRTLPWLPISLLLTLWSFDPKKENCLDNFQIPMELWIHSEFLCGIAICFTDNGIDFSLLEEIEQTVVLVQRASIKIFMRSFLPK